MGHHNPTLATYASVLLEKQTEQFLSRFGKLKQFNMRINSMTGAPLNVPHIFLDRPVEEIIQQLYYMYSNELNYYHVQLRS